MDLGLPSAGTMPRRLDRFASLLREPSRLATEVLEQWCAAPVTAEIRHRTEVRLPLPPAGRTPGRQAVEWNTFLPPERVAELMRISTSTNVQFRTVHLCTGAAKVATASAVVALDRISAGERAVLGTTNTPLGRALAPGGVRRVMVTSSDLTQAGHAARTPGDADAPVLSVTALLCRGTVPVGLVRETFLQRLLD
jgi:chorismate-pyruvate lyase